MPLTEHMIVTDQANPQTAPLRSYGQRWRLPGICLLLLLALGGSLLLASQTPSADASQKDFVGLWQWTYLPYLAACALVLALRPPVQKGRRRLELAIILLGALALRLPLLFNDPNLSHDSWRYVWDARVFLHGYSPYVYAPGAQVLANLRDVIFANSRFRNVPSIYPPGAQYVYILSYLLVPSSLFFLKLVFLAFDMLSCLLLAILLQRKGLDPARVLLYAWCPLPIVEFALEGHVDVLAITASLLVVLAAQNRSVRGRLLTGFLLGFATLTKLYPILMLAALVRLRDWRRDWLLVLTCLGTIVLGYLPFVIQGHGQIFGFFATYADQQGENAGVLQQGIMWLGQSLPAGPMLTWEHVADLLLLIIGAGMVFVLRQDERISLEAGILILFSLVLAISSHVFPWYLTTLLPWVALLWPVWDQRLSRLLLARYLALAATWIFACVSTFSYSQPWSFYYLAVYDPLVIELAVAALLTALSLRHSRQKGITHV